MLGLALCTLPGGAGGRWELGRDARAVSTRRSVGSQVWEGPGEGGVPLGVKQRDSSPCTFPPGPPERQTGRKGHPDMLPFLLQLRLSPSKGRWEVTSPGGLGPTRGGIPGHHSQVQVPKPSDQNKTGSEGRGPRAYLTFRDHSPQILQGPYHVPALPQQEGPAQ